MEQAWLMILGSHGKFDFDSPEVVTDYFRRLYQLLDKPGLDKRGVQQDRSRFDFPIVAEKVRLIDEDTIPVLVPYDQAQFDALQDEITARVRRGAGLTRSLWRRLQPFTVAIYRNERARLGSLLSELVPDQLYAWTGKYDLIKGIGDHAIRDPADYIC